MDTNKPINNKSDERGFVSSDDRMGSDEVQVLRPNEIKSVDPNENIYPLLEGERDFDEEVELAADEKKGTRIIGKLTNNIVLVISQNVC